MKLKNPYKLNTSQGREGGFDSLLSRLGLSRLKITFKGREGRWWRRAAYALAAVILIPTILSVLKPETQVMSSVEIQRVLDRGILFVGVRDDVPGFCEGDSGLEIELAKLLAERILPDADDPIKYFTCTSQTVSTKISDGTIDVGIALMPKGESASYAYSYPYYTDEIYVLLSNAAKSSTDLTELNLGYVQGTPAASVLQKYQEDKTAVVERSFFEKLFGKEEDVAVVDEGELLKTVKYGAYPDMLEAFKRGDIDAVVMQGIFMKKYSKEYTYFRHDTILGEVEYSFVSSSDEPSFMLLADMMIYEMQEDGSLDALIEKYLGND